jgi:uncharacterized sulfatase
VLPTLVESAGATPPTGIDGRSFRNVLVGESELHRDRIFSTHSGDGKMNEYPMRSVRTERWKYIRNLQPDAKHHTHIDQGTPVDGASYWQSWLERAESDPLAAATVERYHHRPAEELYDLQTDPHEQSNLATNPEHAHRLTQLRADLVKWTHEQGDEGIATEQAAVKALDALR